MGYFLTSCMSAKIIPFHEVGIYDFKEPNNYSSATTSVENNNNKGINALTFWCYFSCSKA